MTDDFDPDAYLASAPQQKAPDLDDFDPDAYLAAGAPAEKRIGSAAAAGLGAASGASLGFDDEVAGVARALSPSNLAEKAAAGIGRLFGGDKKGPDLVESYQQGRDQVRDLHKVAKEDRPTEHFLGEMGGGVASSFVPVLGAAKGAGALKMAGRAALEGGFGGIGNSEATDIKGLAKDAGVGAAIGGAFTGAASGVARSSVGRAVKRAVGDITDGVPASLRDRLSGKAGSKINDVYEALQSTPGLAKAVRKDAAAALPAVQAGIDDVGAKLNHVYAKAGDATPGIAKHAIVNDIDAIAAKLEKNPGTLEAAAAVRSKGENVLKAWKDRDYVSPQEVREFASAIAEDAFAGSPAMGYKRSKELSQEIWRTLKDRIDDNIDEAARKVGGVSSTELRTLNKRMNNLMDVRMALTYKATREATPSTRLVSRVQQGLEGAAKIMAVTGNVAPLAAGMAYKHVAKPLVREGDALLAKVVQAAQKGSTEAEIALRAVEWGAAPGAAKEMARWASSNFGGPATAEDR